MPMEKIESSQTKLDLELTLLYALCEVIQSPVSHWMMALAKARLWEKLLDVTIDPNDYDDAEQFADDWLLVNLLRKSDNIPSNVNRAEKAVAAFFAAEAHCAETNARLANGGFPSWFYDVQARFRTILGPLTPSVLERIVKGGRFGPGSVVGLSGNGFTPSIKYDASLTLTHNLVPFSRAILGEPWWKHNDKPRRVVEGNEFFTVPKDARSFRGCAKEPGVNVVLQMGTGEHMVIRLRLFGVDLTDQGWNQRLAEEAYARALATIDLSSASDLNADGLVFALCTAEWYHLLQLARSPVTHLKGHGDIVLAKHSSMGNGYTFPLETAVFKAVVDSVVCDPDERRTSTAVYGDDIIVPQWAAKEVVTRLEFLGFKVNSTKSHLAGDFFESCGKDFFRGVPVRPFYCRESDDEEDAVKAPYVVKLANRLRLYAEMRGVGGVCDPRFKPIWLALVKLCPKPWRDCRVPRSFGDAGILSSTSEIRQLALRLKRSEGEESDPSWDGILVRYVVYPPVCKDRQTYGVFLANARAIGSTDRSTYGREARRGFLGRPMVRVGRVAIHDQGLSWA